MTNQNFKDCTKKVMAIVQKYWEVEQGCAIEFGHEEDFYWQRDYDEGTSFALNDVCKIYDQNPELNNVDFLVAINKYYREHYKITELLRLGYLEPEELCKGYSQVLGLYELLIFSY